ncbi:MAG: tetratricopeptide repeat protein [Prolixibacteraceae bacterium]
MKTSISICIALFVLLFFTGNSQEKIDLLILQKNYDEALVQIDKKLQQKPGAELFLKKGLVLNNLQRFQQAVTAFSAGLQYTPDHFELNTEIANNLSLLGNYHDAESFYQKTVQLQPQNLPVKGKLGRVLINLKNYKKAHEIFSGMYNIDSTNIFWNKQLAFCAYETGKTDQAKMLYEKVIEQNPRDYKTYMNLAQLYKRDEQEKAVALLEQGLQQFPGDANLYLNFANLYFGGKQYELAAKNFEKYFHFGGDTVNFKTRLNYGICTYLSGDEKKALNILRDIYFSNPNDAILLFYVSLCHKKMKNFENAESFMEGAIDMSYPGWLSEMYHHLGQIYGQQRKFKESIDALKKSHEFDPSNPEVLFEIATTYEEYNANKTLALTYYRIYLKEAGQGGKNINYALKRIDRIKEELFFE